LWSQIRNFNLFDPNSNAFRPITYNQTVGGTTPNGTRFDALVNGAPNVSDASATVQHAAAHTSAAVANPPQTPQPIQVESKNVK
jgi:hypothetical protein